MASRGFVIPWTAGLLTGLLLIALYCEDYQSAGLLAVFTLLTTGLSFHISKEFSE